jgi:dipeptidyl aminopeptidase/acylaminoacyl peptidase
MTENRFVKERLDSWKEIATYLHRDIRTVIRWERQRGLPVRRVPGAKRQAVFAYRDEIDTWLAGDRITQDADRRPDNGRPDRQAESHAAEPLRAIDSEPAHAVRGIPFAHRGKIFIASGTLVLAVIGALIVSSRSSTSASVRPLGLQQLTDDNRYKMNLHADQKTLYFNEFEVNREILVSTPIAGGPIRQIHTPFRNVDLQDVSEDGGSILVTSFDGTELDRPLWIISTQMKNAPVRVGALRCRAAGWSRTRHRIACANGTFITLTQGDGSGERRIGPLPGVVTKVAWSPDGQELRFVVQNLQTRDFTAWGVKVDAEVNEHQSAPAVLDWGQNCCTDWTWTENGERFLYVKYENKPVLRMQFETGKGADGQTEVPIHIGYTAWLAPSSEPDSIYLLNQNTLQDEVLKFDTERHTFQTILPSLSATLLAFSRDGKWMTYTDLNNSLWRSRIDGSDPIRLAGPPMEVEFSSWSPDGTQVAFMGREPGRVWRIYLARRDGGEMREASHSDDSQGAPTWSPDGRKLVYGNVDCLETDTCWIRILDLASGKIESMPDSHGFRTARWSPDGKYIAALIPESHKLMLFDVKKERWRPLADSVTGDNVTWRRGSDFVYADSPRGERPVIERFRVSDGKRSEVVNLASLQNVPGQIDFWFGLAPDDSPLIVHRFTASEVYKLNWAGN